jgi:hypothetical protein
MKTENINTMIGKINRRKFIIAFILLFIFVVGYVLFLRYFYNFLLGPFETEPSKLINADSSRELFQYFITVTGDEIYDTGFEYVTVHDSGYEETDYYYYALEMGREFVLVETPERIDTPTVTGFIKRIPSDIQEKVLDQLVSETPSLQGHFMPFMLKTNNFRTGGVVWIITSVGLGAISLILILTTSLQLGNTARHPVMKKLNPFGDPKRIASEIDAELSAEKYTSKLATFTKNWVIVFKGLNFQITRYEEVIWLYKKVTQHRTYGVPTGKTFIAMIYDRHGQTLGLQGKETDVDEALTLIAQKSPWAIKGYSEQLFKLYRKNRPAFLAEVEKRKSSS